MTNTTNRILKQWIVSAGILCITLAAVHFFKTTKASIMACAVIFCLVDGYWALFGIVCLFQRTGDVLKKGLDWKGFFELNGYLLLMFLPFLCYLISIRMWNG